MTMLSRVRSLFSSINLRHAGNTLAPYWRRLIFLSVCFLGLALFFGAEYKLGNMIASDNYFLAILSFVAITILVVTVAYPFWGYSIWFFLSCYLGLFSSMIPAMFSFDLNMLALLTLVLILRALFKRESPGKLSIEEVFLILYFVYAYIIRRPFDPSHMVAEFKYLFLSPLFFYFVAKNVIREKKHIYWLMIVIIVTGSSWALMGIYEQITQKMWISNMVGVDIQMYAGIRSVGPAGNYYVYGNMLILTILLCLHLLGWMQKIYSKLLVVVTCLITLVGLYYGYSRAPYIAFGLSLIIMLVLAKHTKRYYAVGVVMLLLGSLVIVPFVASNSVLRDRFTSRVDARLATDVTSMRMFAANYLFGVGTDKYRTSVPDYVERGHTVYVNKLSGIKNDYSHAHSEYFLKLCELGIVGFVLYFGTYALFLFRIIKLRARLSKGDVVGHDFLGVVFAFMVGVHLTMIADQIVSSLYAIIFAVFAMVKKAEFFASKE